MDLLLAAGKLVAHAAGILSGALPTASLPSETCFNLKRKGAPFGIGIIPGLQGRLAILRVRMCRGPCPPVFSVSTMSTPVHQPTDIYFYLALANGPVSLDPHPPAT